MRTSLRLSLVALLGLAATASGGGGGGARRSTLVRAPAETAATAQWPAVGVDGGATVARWDAGASAHGKGAAAWPWWPPLPPAPGGDNNNERAHLVDPAGAGALDLLDFSAEEEAPDPLSPVERAAAAEEERAMWQALLSAVSATGQVAVQFGELVRLGAERENTVGGATQAGGADERSTRYEQLGVDDAARPRVSSRSPRPAPRPLPLPPNPSTLSIRLEAFLDRLADLPLPRRRRHASPSRPIDDPPPFRLFA